MNHRSAILVSFAFILFWSLNAHSNELKKSEIPKDIYQEALSFYENIQKDSAEVTYSNFDDILKNEVELEQVKALTQQLKVFIKGEYRLDLKKAEFHDAEGGVYALLFHVDTDLGKIEYIVSLKRGTKGILIRGFNFKSLPPDGSTGSFIFKNAKPTHYFVLVSFILCIIAQIYCLVFFMRQKKLKRKWLYVISSLIGFPFGVGIQWATGTFALSLGFKIPAVAISSPIDAPAMWTMSVFFPIGLITMMIVKSRDREQYALVEEKTNFETEST